MPMEFEWDKNKAKSNRVKHGIHFEDAVLLFDDPQHLSQQERIENGEYRFTASWLFWLRIPSVSKAEMKLFESSVHEKQIVKRGIAMSMVKHKRGTSSTLDVQHEAELKALTNKSDEDIDYSDIPPSSDEQWSNAERGKFYRPLKTQASVRIDADVMEWLKRPGKGYQTRLNAILREAMLRDQNKK